MKQRYNYYLEYDGKIEVFKTVLSRQNYIINNKIKKGKCWHTFVNSDEIIDSYGFVKAD